MKLLLDTCTLLWWWSEPEKLSSRCKTLICDPINIIFISAASAWEIATKYRIGKYPGGARIITEWDDRLHIDGFREMAIISGPCGMFTPWNAKPIQLGLSLFLWGGYINSQYSILPRSIDINHSLPS